MKKGVWIAATFHIILTDMGVCRVIFILQFFANFNMVVDILKYFVLHNLCIKTGTLFVLLVILKTVYRSRSVTQWPYAKYCSSGVANNSILMKLFSKIVFWQMFIACTLSRLLLDQMILMNKSKMSNVPKKLKAQWDSDEFIF